MPQRSPRELFVWFSLPLLFAAPLNVAGADIPVPRVADDRLVIELFAASPQIVHPVSATCDARGKLLVIESHTHFPPEGYAKQKRDRVLRIMDDDGDGRAERVQTFFEGTTHSMDIATHSDGSIYLATRNEILRLRDTDEDGVADDKQRIVFLDTTGDYPHNGLSGLHFDYRGNLLFGMGENLGVAYTLIGSDGGRIHDEAEGGNIFHCDANGAGLRRVATGFWNPFGVYRDVYGRIFCVDNDPQANGCRLLHVVEGGNYGYHYRYGRSGLHPFISWRGQLPGTLPMVSYTGEAPCELLAYEAEGLPAEYRGQLLAACWSEHRIEVYRLRRQGASFTADRQALVVGGEDFRPVGMAVAADGSLWVSDWVKRDYKLHGEGRVWRIRLREPAKAPAEDQDARRMAVSPTRRLRDMASRQLLRAGDDEFLLQLATSHTDASVRASAIDALLSGTRPVPPQLARLALTDSSIAIRCQVIRGLLARGQLETVRRVFQTAKSPALRLAALPALRGDDDAAELTGLLTAPDPFLRSAAIHQLATHPSLLESIAAAPAEDPRTRIGVMLALRRSGHSDALAVLPGFLRDADEQVRFMAVKWVADEKIQGLREMLEEGMRQPAISGKLFFAYATALARLENRSADEEKVLESMLPRLRDAQTRDDTKAMILRGAPTASELGRDSARRVPLPVLTELMATDDLGLQMETVRYLAAMSAPGDFDFLRSIADSPHFSTKIRAQAVVGLSKAAEANVAPLLQLARNESAVLREEALRALYGVTLAAEQREMLAALLKLDDLKADRAKRDLVRRLLGGAPPADRPKDDDIDAWLKRLADGPTGDPQAGRRLFAHARLANCVACHRIEGRGGSIGPDLTSLGRQSDVRAILESILQPSRRVAPHFSSWQIVTDDGRIRTGLLLRQTEQDQTYVNPQGELFTVKNAEVERTESVSASIMPEGLLSVLTDQEIRDLLSYLAAEH